MKRTSSVVWRFFDRVEENKRCVAVLCKLCDQQYKYFGNTTNLRSHLVSKHPIQWELLQNGNLDDTSFRAAYEDDESTNQTTVPKKRRKYSRNYKEESVRYSLTVDHNKNGSSTENSMPIISIQRVNSETDVDNIVNEDEITLVHHINESRGTEEEWLNDELYETVEQYQPQRKIKLRSIKREVQSPPKVQNFVIRKPQYQKPEKIIIDNSQLKDEYSVFGEYIANKIKKLKGAQTRGNVQQLITTIMWQAEYGMFDSIENVKRVILNSIQDINVQEEEIMTTEQVIVHEAETPEKENTYQINITKGNT